MLFLSLLCVDTPYILFFISKYVLSKVNYFTLLSYLIVRITKFPVMNIFQFNTNIPWISIWIFNYVQLLIFSNLKLCMYREISLLIIVSCRREGRYRAVRGMSVTVHSMSLLSLFAVILRCCAPQPPRAFRFLRDRYTQGDLDRTDAMAQNGSAGIINHGLNGSFKCILYLTQPMVLYRIANERIFVPCYLPSCAGSAPALWIHVNIIIVLTLSVSYLDTSGNVTAWNIQLFII